MKAHSQALADEELNATKIFSSRIKFKGFSFLVTFGVQCIFVPQSL